MLRNVLASIGDGAEKYQVGLLQEAPAIHDKMTKTKKTLITDRKDYNYFYKDEARTVARAMIVTSKAWALNSEAIKVEHLTNRDQVVVSAKLKLKGGGICKVLLVSKYFPAGSHKGMIDKILCETVKAARTGGFEILVGCDANSHNIAYGSRMTDPRGETLVDFLDRENLSILNIGAEPTYFKPNTQYSSIIDITFATQLMYNKCLVWRVVTKDKFMSDHRAIAMSFNTETQPAEPIQFKKRTNWAKFTKVMKAKMRTDSSLVEEVSDTNDLENKALKLSEALIDAFNICCPPIKKPKKINCQWMTPKILILRERSFALCNNSRGKRGNSAEVINYNKARNKFQKECRKARRGSWRKRAEDMEDLGEISRIQKFLEGKKKDGLNTLKAHGGYTHSIEDTARCLIETHFEGCQVAEGQLVNDYAGPPILTEDDLKDIDSCVDLRKVIWSLESFSPFKSPGEDGIFPALISRASGIIAPVVRNIFKGSLKLGYVAMTWRKSLIAFIPKVGKDDYSDPKSFRPISLMSFILKALEKLIDKHIRQGPLTLNPLNERQHAYQQGKGTDTALHELTSMVERTLGSNETNRDRNKRNFGVAIFVDIAGAFDKTRIQVVIDAARGKGIKVWTLAWLENLLSNRVIASNIRGANNNYIPMQGIPQGSSISPLEWILVMDTLLELISAPVTNTNQLMRGGGARAVGYADDLAMYFEGFDKQTVISNINATLARLNGWCYEKGLNVNPLKTEMLVFSNKTDKGYEKLLENFSARMNGEEILPKSRVKYLGVHFDRRLHFDYHFDTKCKAANKALFAAKAMVSRNWGLTPKRTKWVYDLIVEPRITYGAVVTWKGAERRANSNKLKSLQRLSMKMTTGCTNDTSTVMLRAILNLPSSEDKLKSLAAATHERLKLAGYWMDQTYSIGPSSIRDIAAEIRGEMTDTNGSDAIPQIWDLNKLHTTIIGEPNNWNKEILRKPNDVEAWTDGSKQGDLTGIGIYIPDVGVETSYRIGNHNSIMQAEVTAIRLAIEIAIGSGMRDRNLHIHSDSQAAIKALSSYRINSETVRKCVEAIKEANEIYLIRTTVIWVPAHRGIEGNERADALAKSGTLRTVVDLALPTPAREGTNDRCGWLQERIKHEYKIAKVNRKGKECFKDPSLKFTKDLLNMNRKDVRVAVGLKSSFDNLRSKLANRLIIAEGSCRLCGEDEEYFIHLIKECMSPVAKKARTRAFGGLCVSDKEINEMKPREIVRWAKSLKITPESSIYENFFAVDRQHPTQ